MKFCKAYEEYMRARREKELPVVGLKRLKKTLKRCRREYQSQHSQPNYGGGGGGGGGRDGGSKCADNCAGVLPENKLVPICFI